MHKYGIWICVALILLGVFGKIDYNEYINSIEVKDVYAYVDESLKNTFKTISDDEDVVRYYNISYTTDPSKSNITLTSDFSKITSEEYKTLNYSPLIFVMKETKDLNNFLTSNTKQGWLISESEIKNDETDKINCDFKKVFDVVVAGGDWSDLGGSDVEIKIYCPSLETKEGQLFKEFLVRILNNGSKSSNKEIDSQIDKFFSSTNVIQTDVISKLEKLQNNIPPNELYVSLESDFLNYVRHDNDIFDISFIYPETCILSEIYLQYTDVDDKLKEELESDHIHSDTIHNCMNCYFDYEYYRDGENHEIYENDRFDDYYNIQTGINTFDMKYM